MVFGVFYFDNTLVSSHGCKTEVRFLAHPQSPNRRASSCTKLFYMLDTITLKALLKQDTKEHKSDGDFAQVYPFLFRDLTAPNDYEMEELDKFQVNIQTFQSVVSLFTQEAVKKSHFDNSPQIANVITMNIRDLGADAFDDLVRMIDNKKNQKTLEAV